MIKRKKISSIMLATCFAFLFGTAAYAEDSGRLLPYDVPEFDIILPETIINYEDIEGLEGDELIEKILELLGNPDVPLALGDTDEDLVYTPVAPCRIVDTRNSGGVITGGYSRSFLVYGAAGDLNGQGGNAAGCFSPVGEPQAVHVNVTVVPASGGGNVRVYPAGETTPNASLVNYKPGVNIANAATVQTTAGTAGEADIEVYTSQDAHVVIDVMGYYAMPEKTALEAYTTGIQGFVLNNDVLALGAPCASGFTVTGGGWLYGFPIYMDVVAAPINEGYGCIFANFTGATQEVWCYTRCVQTPGR